MEFSEIVQLTHRKESVAIGPGISPGTEKPELLPPFCERTYPFAIVLRLRVLQIVCGISSLVMGMVAFIEQREEFSLALGIPAGAATVLAAAASIHTSRGFDGYRAASCPPGSKLRFLGPSVRVAAPLCILWGCACALQTVLLSLALRNVMPPTPTPHSENHEPRSVPDPKDLVVLASIQIFLTTTTLTAVIVLLRIDCKYDPD